jgi:[protein-PII] uridylyltransferase
VTRPQPGDALLSLAARTAAVDARVAEAAEPWLEPGIAILASGGYGRRQLFPHSDVDLLLLFESEQLAAERKNAISTFLQGLWDAGMRVSQQVRTPAECLEVHEGNTELNISLLDQRFLLGDRGLYAALSKKFPAFIERNRDALSRNLVQLTRKRHEKYSGTYYHLEPNVKETPGGLRDFQLVQWMGQLRDADAGRRFAGGVPVSGEVALVSA